MDGNGPTKKRSLYEYNYMLWVVLMCMFDSKVSPCSRLCVAWQSKDQNERMQHYRDGNNVLATTSRHQVAFALTHTSQLMAHTRSYIVAHTHGYIIHRFNIYPTNCILRVFSFTDSPLCGFSSLIHSIPLAIVMVDGDMMLSCLQMCSSDRLSISIRVLYDTIRWDLFADIFILQ